ncbi:MAG TPA: WhiB family transcriptional regulator [Xanthomonadales bacterium]|nr:WhiB family transcriptional regulator [Xanthomonadales bacterium]
MAGNIEHYKGGRDTEWMKSGLCKTTNTSVDFLPSNAAGVKKARTVCNTPCPVREDCFSYAMNNGMDSGVWGGISKRGRKALRVERIRKPKNG